MVLANPFLEHLNRSVAVLPIGSCPWAAGHKVAPSIVSILMKNPRKEHIKEIKKCGTMFEHYWWVDWWVVVLPISSCPGATGH